MPHSFFQTASLTCPQCGRAFSAEVWLIVDTVERPDLLARIRDGTLHTFPCPGCGHEEQVDAPLLLYTPPPRRGRAGVGVSSSPRRNGRPRKRTANRPPGW